MLPSVAAVVMFGLVHIELRLVAPFVVLLYLHLLCSVRSKSGKGAGRRFAVAASLLCVAFVVVEMPARLGDVMAGRVNGGVASDKARRGDFAEVAEGLRELGLAPGDAVASREYSNQAHIQWAPLARVRIVAELYLGAFEPNEQLYWRVSEEQKRRVMEEFRGAGARAVIAQAVPDGMVPAGWRRVRSTRYWAYFFSDAGPLGNEGQTPAC